MQKHSSVYGSLIIAFIGVSIAGFVGCKSSDDFRQSRKGEACQVTNDCTSGLSCVPVPGESIGTCVTSEFKISKTAKSCKIIECQEATDCCPAQAPESAQCKTLAAECADGGTDSYYCTDYQEQCPTQTCDSSRYACNDGSCQYQCSTDSDCGGQKCSGGQCVQCVGDSDCSNGDTCDNGVCQPPCQSDGDCPAFNRCGDDGQCVESGCKTDRECVAATRNVEAHCDQGAGQCIVPCQTDLECGNPKDYNFYSCIENQCVYVGCDSDKDCELYLTGGSDAGISSGTSLGGTTHHVECVDPNK
ncbi:MAG: hypothetical protein ABI551_25830 [Polyangiaceae bacterium]